MTRRKKVDENKTGGGFLVMTVSLNLILLVFFVYINSIGVNDSSRVKKAFDSLIGTFGILPGGLNITPGKRLLLPGPPMNTQDDSSIDISEKLRELIGEADTAGKIEISIKGKDLVINMADTILFSSGSAELEDKAIDLLDRISSIIKASSLPLRIEGHTDNLPISTERYPSNWELSAARAVAVLRYLSERYDIPHDRLSAVGFAEFQPLATNDTPDNMAKNRRVSIVLVGGGKNYGKKG